MNNKVNCTEKISVTVTPAKSVRFQTPSVRLCAMAERENRIPLSKIVLKDELNYSIKKFTEIE